MSIQRRARVVAAVFLGAALVAGAVGIAAAGSRVTRGDVMAAAQARTTGYGVLNAHGVTVAAPVTGMSQGRISPFTTPGRVYCEDDWHVLLVSYGGEPTHREAVTFIRRFDATFALDGKPMATARTAVKRFLPQSGTPFFGVTIYRLMSPGSIAVGDHVLVTTFIEAGNPYETLTVPFSVAACDR
jgi:hypothetical protein